LLVLPDAAVSVTFSLVVTAETVAVNEALVAPAATVTLAGTFTAALLLVSFTAKPPVAAAELSVTLQASLPAPVSVALEHETLLSAATVPVPLSAMAVLLPVVELLARVILPLTAPAALGSYLTLRVAVLPAVRVTGKVTPEMLNPVPVTVALLIVSVAVPEDFNVSDFVTAVFTGTSPKATLEALRLSSAFATFSVTAVVLDAVAAVAFTVAVCVEVTAEAVAVKAALVLPAATVTLAGTLNAVLLLVSVTLVPSLGAAAVSVTLQASLPAPVSAVLPHETALRPAVAVAV